MTPNREQCIAWAREAGMVVTLVNGVTCWLAHDPALLDRFAALAYRAGLEAERERCARICDRAGGAAFGRHEAFEDGCDYCAKTIRADEAQG